MRTLNRMNGYKTIIGATLLFLATVLPMVVQYLTDIGADPQYAAWVGAVLMVVGVLHKIWKKFFPPNPGPDPDDLG